MGVGERPGANTVTVMGFCSAVTLAFATIFSLVAAALLAIAFSTDNWITINVNRNQLRNKADISDQDLNQSPLYFTRTRGLFRECYLGEKLDDDPENTQVPLAGLVEVYMSPVETWCRNVDYYIPDENDVTKTFNKEQMTRIHMMRAMIALFIVGFFFMFVSFTASKTELFKSTWNNDLKDNTEII